MDIHFDGNYSLLGNSSCELVLYSQYSDWVQAGF